MNKSLISLPLGTPPAIGRWRGTPYDDIVVQRLSRVDARPGVSSMNLAFLIVGICAFLAGFLAIIFGLTIREFSLGGTLIISGTIGVCSGMLLVGLHLVLLELKGIARRLAGVVAPSEVRVRPVLPGLAVPGEVEANSRLRRRRRHRRPQVRRRGRAKLLRASVRASRQCRSRKLPRRPPLRKRRAGATCCSLRPRARSASARTRRRPKVHRRNRLRSPARPRTLRLRALMLPGRSRTACGRRSRRPLLAVRHALRRNLRRPPHRLHLNRRHPWSRRR